MEVNKDEEMEEVTVFFSDTGLSHTLLVSASDIAKMNSDHSYATQLVVASLKRKEAADRSADVGSTASPCTTKSPATKRFCTTTTPEAFKTVGHFPSSTPKSCSKSLNFGVMSSSSDSSSSQHHCLKISNVPHPFLERNLILCIEKMRKKIGIAPDIVNVVTAISQYSKEARTAIVTFISHEIAALVLGLREIKFLQHTIGFSSITEETVPNTNDDVYNDKTIIEAGVEMLDLSSEEVRRCNTSSPVEIIEDMSNVENQSLTRPLSPMLINGVCRMDERDATPKKDSINTSNLQTLNPTDFSSNSLIQPKIIVSGLPSNFEEKHLRFTLNKYLWAEEKVAFGTDCVMSISSDHGKVVVEFVNEKHAATIKAAFIKFKGALLDISSYQPPPVTTFNNATLQISNLPSDYDTDTEEFLKYTLNEYLWNGSDFTSVHQGESGILKWNVEGDTVVVQLVNAECAACLMSLKEIKFVDTVLRFSLLPNQAVHDNSIDEISEDNTKATITGLPPHFDEKQLKFTLNKYLWDKGKGVTGTSCVVSLSSDNNQVVVEFASEEHARSVKSASLTFKGAVLTITPYQSAPTFDSTKLKISNLPCDYDEDTEKFLKYSINECLWEAPEEEKTGLRQGDDAIVQWNVDDDSVVVQFVNAECRAYLMSLQKMKFCNTLLLFSDWPNTLLPKFSEERKNCRVEDKTKVLDNLHCNEMDHTPQDTDFKPSQMKNHDSLKSSPHVVIKNLPPQKFIIKDFKSFLLNEMKEAGFVTADDDDNDIIEKVFDYNSSSMSVIVKFAGCELATLATLLQSHYMSRRLLIRKIAIDDDGNDKLLDVDNTEENEDPVTISDSVAIDLFLKLLARFRDDFPKSGSHDPMLESFIPFLSENNVTASLRELRSKKSTLRDNHRKLSKDILEKKNMPDKKMRLYNVGRVAFEKANDSILKNTKFEWTMDDEKLYASCMEGAKDGEGNFLQSLANFSQCGSWTTKTTLALARACLEHKDMYDIPKMRGHFWRKVSETLAEETLHYAPHKCSLKMGYVLKEYLNYCDQSNRTGSAGPLEVIKDDDTRELMEVVHEWQKNNVNVKPRMLMGAGLDNVYEESKVAPCTSDKSGRTRPPTLNKHMSLKERKVAADEKKASALLKIANKFSSD